RGRGQPPRQPAAASLPGGPARGTGTCSTIPGQAHDSRERLGNSSASSYLAGSGRGTYPVAFDQWPQATWPGPNGGIASLSSLGKTQKPPQLLRLGQGITATQGDQFIAVFRLEQQITQQITARAAGCAAAPQEQPQAGRQRRAMACGDQVQGLTG